MENRPTTVEIENIIVNYVSISPNKIRRRMKWSESHPNDFGGRRV